MVAATGAVRCCEAIGLDSGPMISTNRYPKITADTIQRFHVGHVDQGAIGAVVETDWGPNARASTDAAVGSGLAVALRFRFLFFELMTL